MTRRSKETAPESSSKRTHKTTPRRVRAAPRTRLVAFDASRYLGTKEAAAEYLDAILEADDPGLFVKALGDIARARGMVRVARDSGLGRESLYKALATNSKPRFETIVKVARALGLRIKAQVA